MYFIVELENTTTKIIYDAIEESKLTASGNYSFLNIEEIKIDFRTEIEREEEILEEDLENTKKDLIIMRDRNIVSQLEIFCPEKFELIQSQIQKYMNNSINGLAWDLKAFIEHSPNQTLSIKKQKSLIRSHKKVFIQTIISENPYFPKSILANSWELFQESAKEIIKISIEKPLQLNEIEDFKDEWQNFIDNR